MGQDMLSYGESEFRLIMRDVVDAAVAYYKLRNSGPPYSPIGSKSDEGRKLCLAIQKYMKACNQN